MQITYMVMQLLTNRFKWNDPKEPDLNLAWLKLNLT